MTSEDLAKLLRGRRSGKGRWRAKCPVHRSRGLTLSIIADTERTHITCFAGCRSDDVLATLGLTWQATLYNDSTFSPEERRKWVRQKYIDELYEREQRMQDLKMMLHAVEFGKNPVRIPTQFERDIEAFCARFPQ